MALVETNHLSFLPAHRTVCLVWIKIGSWEWYQCSPHWSKSHQDMKRDRPVALQGWMTVNHNRLFLITVCVGLGVSTIQDYTRENEREHLGSNRPTISYQLLCSQILCKHTHTHTPQKYKTLRRTSSIFTRSISRTFERATGFYLIGLVLRT